MTRDELKSLARRLAIRTTDVILADPEFNSLDEDERGILQDRIQEDTALIWQGYGYGVDTYADDGGKYL